MYSERFRRPVVITAHAAQRMTERGIDSMQLLDLIDTGTLRYSDATRLWAFKAVSGRNDNLLCAVLVLEEAAVVKTVMHHFEEQ